MINITETHLNMTKIVLSKITGKTLWDRSKSRPIQQIYQVEDIYEWVVNRKKECNAHDARRERITNH